MRWTWIGVAVAAMGAGCFSTTRVPAPPGDELEVRRGAFPHEALDGVLAKNVDDTGKVDYRTLAAERVELERYLTAVSKYSPDSHPDLFTTEAQKLAYWINAYNAYVLFAITERPAMRSVADEKANFFYFTEYVLGGEELSLYALENDIVRERFQEPRIHFALNCASAGCPELPAEAFVPGRLEEQLTEETHAFCADRGKVEEASDGVVRMSKIFDWYEDDFEAAGGAIAFCRARGREDLPADAKLEFIPYDWTLNAQPGRLTARGQRTPSR